MNWIAWIIIASEILFWIVILAGLIARYMLHRKKLGFILLASTPLIDFILLVATSVDLYRGSIATQAHALAAVYIGVSLIFGKSMIQWADERFRYYVTKQGSLPPKRYGLDYAKHYFKGWIKHLFSYALGAGILYGLVVMIQDPGRTEALVGMLKLWTVVLAIDLALSLTYFIWPKKAKA
ncbi:hypothetical protein KDJ56_16545 [Brevibacillus composti]|uniref:Membrane protein YmcC n=1 Tax=Brevibacillus composti TaxID=2796470 RepID=A0A7T5JML7_9BACL|nr:hypothetical protein [Brevibacillus composti]QQE73498.1 hypothetical protein JD108_16600 [Brevibacillus composti]QUO40580.1 hypothetical protein KDJ56_16545 [Brevibacillus composti]